MPRDDLGVQVRLLSGTLAAQQLKGDGEPYVRVRIAELLAGVRRLRFGSLYSGAEADQPHGMGVFGNGTVLRARRSLGTTFRYQAVASPSGGSNWGTYTAIATLGSGTYVAAAAAGVYGIVAVDDGNSVKVIGSADSGATWSGLVTARAGAAACGPMAAGIRPDGDAAVFWLESGMVYGARRTAGVWGSRVASSLAFTAISGIGACFDGADWVVAITGTAATTGKPTVWTQRWGDGGAIAAGTWESAQIVRQEDDASLSYGGPFINRVDTYRLNFVERWAGAGAYTLNLTTWPPLLADYEDNAWREPVVMPTALTYGVAVAGTATTVYWSAASRVLSAALPDPAGTDYTDAVVFAEWSEPGRATVILDNRAGTLTDAITLGAEVQIVGGWRTGAGREIPSSGPFATYWIDAIEQREDRGRSWIVIGAGDIWSLLDRSLARKQIVFTSADIATIVRKLAAAAGVGFALGSSSAEILSITPALVVPAGASATSAIRRVLRLVEDIPVQDGALLRTVLTGEGDASVYGYGGAGEHPVMSYARRDAAVSPAFVRVVAGSAAGQAQDDDAIALLGDAGVAIADRSISTGADAATEAGARLRRAQIEGFADTLVSLPNVGLTEADVVSVTAPRLGLAAAGRRVRRVVTRFDRRTKYEYVQTVALGAV